MPAAIVVLLGILLILPTPTPMPAIQVTDPICFEGITDCVDARLAAFWHRNDRHTISGQSGNALRLFGYPIGPARITAVNGIALLAQPFEQVIVQQPLSNSDPSNIRLHTTGLERLQQLRRDPKLPATPPATVPDGCRIFPETGFAICNEFRNFWESNGLNLDNERGYTDTERIALFGLPLSNISRETDGSGNRYLTQWFERARLQIDSVTRQIIITPLGRAVTNNRPNPPPLPRNNGVILSSTTIPAGSAITARGNGYTGDRWAQVTIVQPDGSSAVAWWQQNGSVSARLV